MNPPPTRLRRHIDLALKANGQPDLETLVRVMRPGSSWRSIASTIAIATGEECSDVNLINWFAEKETA